MTTKFNSKKEAEQLMSLCVGRLFNLGSREFNSGDIENYEQLKNLFLDAADFIGLQHKENQVSYQKDYYKIHKD